MSSVGLTGAMLCMDRSMYILEIEFDRARDGETRREKRIWAFSEKATAEAEAEQFTRLAQAGSVNFLRGGDKLALQECRLYLADASDHETAKAMVVAGKAQLLRHGFNPGLDNPDYWEEFLAQLDEAELA